MTGWRSVARVHSASICASPSSSTTSCSPCWQSCSSLVPVRQFPHFGMVIRGVKFNESRVIAVGFPTRRYKLTAFYVAHCWPTCGLAGALLANQTLFVSPSLINWIRSGELLIMVMAGEMGRSSARWWCNSLSFARTGPFELDRLLAGLRRRDPRDPGADRQTRRAWVRHRKETRQMNDTLLWSKNAPDEALRRPGGERPVIDLHVPRGGLQADHRSEWSRKDHPDCETLQDNCARTAAQFISLMRHHPFARSRSCAASVRPILQITNVVAEMTALDNVALAVQAQDGHSFRFGGLRVRNGACASPQWQSSKGCSSIDAPMCRQASSPR